MTTNPYRPNVAPSDEDLITLAILVSGQPVGGKFDALKAYRRLFLAGLKTAKNESPERLQAMIDDLEERMRRP